MRGRETHHIVCSRPDHQGDYRDDDYDRDYRDDDDDYFDYDYRDDDDDHDYDRHQHYVLRIPEHLLNILER